MVNNKKEIAAIQDWLNSQEKDILVGAELLLRINRNRMMYQRIIRSRNIDKLTYELRKNLRIMLDGKTRRDVVVMEHQVLPKVQETLAADPVLVDEDIDAQNPAQYVGKRADHDELPEDIKALYERNGEVFIKMKETYNNLLQMADKEPCDRYELLKLLDELDSEYRENWAKYDAWTASEQPITPTGQPLTAKQVNAARKYLSDNRNKIASIEEEDKKSALLAKMQARVSLLVAAGETFDKEYQQELEGLGLSFS